MNQLKFVKKVHENSNYTLEKSNEILTKNQTIILSEISMLLLHFNIIDDKLKLSRMDLIKTQNKLFKIIDDLINDEITGLSTMMDSSLNSIYDKVAQYYNYNGNFKNNVVDAKFKKKNFKERQFKNSSEINKRLKHAISKFLKGQIEITSILNIIGKIYKTNKCNFERLLITENNRVLNIMILQLNKDKKFRYQSVLEKNTCDDCRNLNGQIFTYEEAINLIPQHSNCLCYWEVLGDEKTSDETVDSSLGLEYNNVKIDKPLQFKDEFIKKDYEELESKFKGKLSDLDVRKWYIWHDENIPYLIDKTKSVEEQARQAFNMRNMYRTQARELMFDQETRKMLDATRPNKGFEDLVNSKMIRKNMTREEAIYDIYKTATKTNSNVNKSLGLE